LVPFISFLLLPKTTDNCRAAPLFVHGGEEGIRLWVRANRTSDRKTKGKRTIKADTQAPPKEYQQQKKEPKLHGKIERGSILLVGFLFVLIHARKESNMKADWLACSLACALARSPPLSPCQPAFEKSK
jgi:hypothetical protein